MTLKACGSQIHLMNMIFITFIIFFVFLSLQSSTSLIAAEYFNGHGLQRLDFVEKVSGGDENGEKEALILEKFRVLLGLKSFHGRSAPFEYGYPPSPSPSPAIEAPAPVPMVPTHVHPHHRLHHSHPISQLHKIHNEDGDKGRVKRILISVLVSAGAVIVLFFIGFIWVLQKFRRQRKGSRIPVSLYGNEGGNKVSSDPGLDLFYLDTLETALEPQAFGLKQNGETEKAVPKQDKSSYKSGEREESSRDSVRSESEKASCSAAGEITPVHESAESVNYESDGCNSSNGDQIVPAEAQSSDDESFHSLCDSHSSNTRLSNASAASLSDTSEVLSPRGANMSPCSMELQFHAPTPTPTPTPTPPPPPPPPPLPSSHLLVSPRSSYSLTQMASKAASSSTLAFSSSPRNSDSSSGSNQTPKTDLPPSPPDPPKPPLGIPPPPCPPPLFKGNGNSLKGPPPPPPSQLPQFVPLGKDGAPLPKLKPLHWDKVRAAPDRSMVWDKLRSSSFEFDEEMIESLFGYNLQNSMKNDEAKSKSPSPSKHVLEPKRLQNITILSKALNVTAQQVCDALLQGKGLCLQQLEALAKMVPTKEEESKLSSYKGVKDELSSVEKFVKEMLSIPFAFLRIEALLYRETFEDEVVHLRKSFSMLEEACKELRSSRLFLKLLEAVLKTGNRMNVGTIRGGARAFKLDALLKLADVKGTDGRTTLLHFVVQEIVRSEGMRVLDSIMGKIDQKRRSKNSEEGEEDFTRMGLDLVSGLSIELCNVKKTATIDLDVLASSVSNLSDEMAKLQQLVGTLSDENTGNFVNSMKSFLVYAEKNIKELQEDEGRVLLHVRQITEYFHGGVSKEEANPLRIFVIVRDFLGMLDHVCKELRGSKVPRSPNPLAPFR